MAQHRVEYVLSVFILTQNPPNNRVEVGIGFVLYDSDETTILETFSALLGFNLTRNVGEYKALVAALQNALDRGITRIIALGDSELVCKQVKGEYMVRAARLRRYYNTVLDLAGKFESFQILHIPREQNTVADGLAKGGTERPYLGPNTLNGYDVPSAPSYISACMDDKSAIVRSCWTRGSTRRYILEKRCQVTAQLRYILDVIHTVLPDSYAAVAELCREIKQEMEICGAFSENNICMCGVYPDHDVTEDVEYHDHSADGICMCCLLAMS